ncbi:MAG TPA: phosphoribosyltransferase family protein, partial [Fimbriimonadaceae bacterium]|nr:phosphoribosyltransferase family protein [Fimbriimonadaceae bacterium]
MQGRFANRQEAGLELAKKLAHLEGEDVVVLGLARGGVVVAAEVAKALCAPLEAFVARKLGVPWQPELGFGAVAEGVRAVQEDLVRRLSLSREDIERVARREEAEAARRVAAYLRDRPRLDLRGRVVVLIDDGLATGITAIAAARAIRLHAPARLVFAAPVCSLQGA